MKRLLFWLRYGTIRAEVRDSIEGIICEIAYIDRFGRVVGYWAHGYYEPDLPYQGQQ